MHAGPEVNMGRPLVRIAVHVLFYALVGAASAVAIAMIAGLWSP
jgi:hypothetical protein